MLNEVGKLKIPGAILSIEIINNNICILDNKYRLFIYSIETYTLVDNYVLLDSQEDKHIYEKSLCISKNLDVYESFFKSSSGSIFTINNHELSQSLPIELNKRNVSYAKFSPDAKTLLIGGEDGIVYFYDPDSKRSQFSLEPRADFISCATFSHNTKLVCIGAYDKAIEIQNIDKHTLISKVEVSDTVEDIIFFDDDSGVVGITRDRRIFSYSIKNDELIFGDTVFNEWPTSMVRVGFNHVLVGTKGDILYIFKIDDLILLRKFRVDNFGVTTLKVNCRTLYIGYSNGELKIVDMDFLYKEFELNLKSNKFAKATSLMKSNIFLMTSEIVKNYDKVWPQVLDMAKDIIAAKDLERAEKLAKPFFWDTKKKEEFIFLNANVANYKHFEDLVQRGSKIVALKFADEKEYLKTTKSYKELDKDFYKVFQLAKGMFAKDTPEAIQHAKETISPYLAVESKKSMINNLLQHHKVFVRSSKLIKVRNFKVYFNLVQKNQFLTEEALYTKVVEIGNQTYSQLLKIEHEGHYDKALQVADYLIDFTPFYDKVIEVEDTIDAKLELQELIEEDNIHAVYEIISELDFLELSSIFSDYHKKFEMQKEQATKYANEGNTPKVQEIFTPYLGIDYLLNTITATFKLSYLVEIELAIQNNPDNIDIRLTLERYALIFGVDAELQKLSEKLQFTQLLPDVKEDRTSFNIKDFFDRVVILN
ncbi:hypothetical protein [Sulfurimonas sp.]|uniref:hypothetical protein n=1 Tax=Sulfurimonas sp. TaxID=2022749 RepID=UPI002AB03F7F|nr:hypothetical protein [Sulfurimonas sp.]